MRNGDVSLLFYKPVPFRPQYSPNLLFSDILGYAFKIKLNLLLYLETLIIVILGNVLQHKSHFPFFQRLKSQIRGCKV